MRIVFMGSPDGAAYLLKEVFLSSRHEIISVVTAIDKPSGRGKKLTQSPVAKQASVLGLKVLKPKSLSDVDFLDNIKDLLIDIIIVVAFGKILPKSLLNLPKYGCINIHFSLLPKYRGASPIQEALLNGDKETGITIMQMNEKMDEGDIILQKKVKIMDQENAETLSKKMYFESKELLFEALELIESNKAPKIPQNNSLATYTKQIKKTDGLIDLNIISTDKLLNYIRAYTPWPGVFLEINNKKIKILSAERYSAGFIDALVGQIVYISKEGFVIKTIDGFILIKEVHPENSKIMQANNFINGYRIKIGDIFTNAKK